MDECGQMENEVTSTTAKVKAIYKVLCETLLKKKPSKEQKLTFTKQSYNPYMDENKI